MLQQDLHITIYIEQVTMILLGNSIYRLIFAYVTESLSTAETAKEMHWKKGSKRGIKLNQIIKGY